MNYTDNRPLRLAAEIISTRDWPSEDRRVFEVCFTQAGEEEAGDPVVVKVSAPGGHGPGDLSEEQWIADQVMERYPRNNERPGTWTEQLAVRAPLRVERDLG
jgi:hypothetical protein